jgi:hypothetical protein
MTAMAKATLGSATLDWGTPDPRDADAYPKVALETPMTQWAWEFLRRRQDYRTRWEKLVKPFIKADRTWDQETEDRLLEENFLLYVWPIQSLGAEFGVRRSPGNHYLDPRTSHPPVFKGLTVETVHQLSEYDTIIRKIELPTIIFVFDARLPADPQFASAKEKFQQDAKEWYQSRNLPPPGKVRPHVGKFTRYLRLLDFGSTPDNEIGSYLFPDKSGEALRDMISKNLDAARNWRENYLLIAHYPAK